eukprot:jgi/Chlat1/9174/Chrsp97S08455
MAAEVSPVGPRLDESHTRAHNLQVLQRHDPNIEEILGKAASATLYQLDASLQWSKDKNVEGPLFIVKRRTQPYYKLFVMNRRTTENHVADLIKDFTFEVTGNFLFYRNSAQEVFGLWLYNITELEAIAAIITNLMAEGSTQPQHMQMQASSAAPAHQDTAASRLPATSEAASESRASEATTTPAIAMNGADAIARLFSEATIRPLSEVSRPLPLLQQQQPPGGSQLSILKLLSQPLQSQQASVPPTPPMRPPHWAPSSALSLPTPITPAASEKKLLTPSSFFASPIPQAEATKSNSEALLRLFKQLDSPPSKPRPSPASIPVLQLLSTSASQTLPAAAATAPMTRERLRTAMLRLVQDDRFIDMLHEELTKD